MGRSLDGIRAGRTLTIHTSDWLFGTTCRYCPACLAGDGSSVQHEHGGPWQSLWRLPVVFACPRHNAFLEHLCPSCKKPINANNQAQLVARPAATGIHPAHCRSSREQDKGRSRPGPPCGAPLGHHTPGGHRPGPALLNLQNKIISMFGANCPEQEAHQYFTEFILLAGLVMISWTRIRPAGTTNSLAAAVDQHLAILEDTDGRLYHSSKAPVDARACAGILQVTDRILAAEDLREALVPLAPEENRTLTGITPSRHVVWDKAFRKHRSACSERFQLAADTVVHSFRRTGRGGYRLPTAGIRYRPEHIPASLPQALADSHLQSFADITPKMLRRSASVFLVRRARGGNLNEAAQFLGISAPGKLIGYGNKMNQYLRAQGKVHDFELALDAITDKLHEGPLIDYRQRREALNSWTLEPDVWQHMVAQLPILPGHQASISNDRKRLAVSVYIWTRVTEGELEFAPCPPHIAHDPELRTIWSRQRHNICHWLRRADQHPYYRSLKPLLDTHAEQLAKAIDNGPATLTVTTSLPM